MSQPLLLIVIVVGFLLLSMAWRRLYVYSALRRLRISYPSHMAIALEEMPADIRQILEAAAQPLLEHGFEHVGCQQSTPAIWSSERRVSYSSYYFHRATASFAHLLPADTPEPGAIAVIIFETWLCDGRIFGTLNRRRHITLPLPENYLLDDGYLESVAAQWEFHQQRLVTVEGERIADYAEMVRHNEALGQATVNGWYDSGLTRAVAEGEWQLKARAALRHAEQLFAASRRVARLAAPAATASLEARVSADLLAYQAYERQLEQGRMGRRGKVLLFSVSALVGAVAFGLAFNWQIVPVLLGVLLFHEFGHALAMRATGYRNVQVMVIPLLGAVASGRKDDAGPWAKLVVLLAGPLPGLLMAIVILHGIAANPAEHPLLQQIGVMALIINLFNLLPFTPLDGGQIVETFLFSRWPRLRYPFFIASGAALAAVAFWLDSMPLFGFAVFLLLISRRRGISFRLARHIGTVDREEAPRAILTAIHAREEKSIRGFAQRLHLLRSMLPLVLSRPLRLGESLFGVAIYLAVIAMPLFSLSDVPAARQLYNHFFGAEQTAVTQVRNWDEELAKATTAEQRWALLNEAAAWEEEENYELEAAHRRYQQALAIAQDFAPGDLRLLDTKIALARTSTDEHAALAGYRGVLEEVAQLPGVERLRYAVVLEALYHLDSDASLERRITYLRQAIAVREANKQPFSYELGKDHEEIARALYRPEASAIAEAELRQALTANNSAYQSLPLIWLLISEGKAAEAESMVRDYSKSVKQVNWLELQLDDALAWALLIQGKRNEGYALLSKALDMTKPAEGWQRYYLMLDLIRFSGDDLKLRTHWRAQLRRELIEAGIGAKRLMSGMEMYGERAPWGELRNKARLESLELLGLSQEDPPQSCSPHLSREADE